MKTPEEMQAHAEKMGLAGQTATFSAGEKSAAARGMFNISGGDSRRESRSEFTANQAMAAEADERRAERERIARVLGPQGKNR